MIDIIPSFLGAKGNRARSKLGLAFQHYFENYRPDQDESAALTKSRYSINSRYGLTSWNQGRLEVGMLLGILSNTIPAVFYMLVHVFSDPNLLRDLREEIETACVLNASHGITRRLEIFAMQDKCPLLYATFQEMLRHHVLGSSIRYVLEDTLLQDTWLLKKGMIVQIPMSVTHFDASAWGTDVQEFRPRRFLRENSKPASYRPFGGGTSLCHGRHLVTKEAMALTAEFILRFDITPVDGEWRVPAQMQESMVTVLFPPAEDIRVRISERRGHEEGAWNFSMTEN